MSKDRDRIVFQRGLNAERASSVRDRQSEAFRIMSRLMGLSIVIGCLTHPAAAQVSIRVMDAEGRPVPAVRVDVLGQGELIAVASTSANGIAELSAERWSEVRRITLSHLGFRTLIVQADEIPADGVIRLEPRAVGIEGFTVEGRELCPIDDDPEARRLWSEVASLYATDTGSRALSARYTRHSGSVSEGDLHETPPHGGVAYVSARGAGIVHGGDLTPRSLDTRVSNEGYAWPPLFIGGTSSDRGWRYPGFGGPHAFHFASAVFGRLHDFEVMRASDGRVMLAYCPNGTSEGASIEGGLTLAPGRALLAAEWMFHTDDPDQGAGGSVWFEPYVEAPGLKPHLMAARGTFHRHSGAELPYPDLPRSYTRSVTVWSGWYVHSSAEHPCKPGGGLGHLTIHQDPSTSADGIRFNECLARSWARP